MGRETAEGAGREERVWPEGVARVAPGYTLRALVGFSRRYIPCRGHHSVPPIRTGVRGPCVHTRSHNPAWIRQNARRSAYVYMYVYLPARPLSACRGVRELGARARIYVCVCVPHSETQCSVRYIRHVRSAEGRREGPGFARVVVSVTFDLGTRDNVYQLYHALQQPPTL